VSVAPAVEPAAGRAAAPAIRVAGVGFRYPGAPQDALRGVSFEIGPRELVGVVGPNGGGKTTLMRLLLGQLEPREGEVRVLGRRPADASERVGYVPQQASVDPTVPATVLDLVLTGRLAASSWGPWYGRRDLAAAREGLERTGTADLADRSWATLSGGQRQRVLIARALASHPGLLLLDEPTSGVDLHREQAVLELLHRLNAEMPIVMVSHDIALVSTHMDTALWVNREVAALPAAELTVAAVEHLFHGERSCHPVEAEAGGAAAGPGPA